MSKKKSQPPASIPTAKGGAGTSTRLLSDLRELILSTQAGVAHAVDAALVLLYWEVGHRIRTDILKSQRAGYGEQVVSTLAAQLALEFGQGFADKNLRRMDPACRGVPRPGDCRNAVTTIGLELLCRNPTNTGRYSVVL